MNGCDKIRRVSKMERRAWKLELMIRRRNKKKKKKKMKTKKKKKKKELERAYISSEEPSFHPIKPYQHSVPPRHLLRPIYAPPQQESYRTGP